MEKNIALDCDAGSDKNNPIAYESGSQPIIKALFQPDFEDIFYIRANYISGDSLLPPKKLVANQGCVIYPFTIANQSTTPGVVQYFPSFYIVKKISKDNSNWFNIGGSEHKFYFTREYSSSVRYQPPYQWSIIHMSCTYAKGLSDKGEIVDSIYSHFIAGDVRTVDGHQLGYWKERNGCHHAEVLVVERTGYCQAWANLQQSANNIQGISGDMLEVLPTQVKNYPSLKIDIHSRGYGFDTMSIKIIGKVPFSVKNWAPDEIKYMGTVDYTDVDKWLIFLLDDMGGELGHPGQNNPNPRSIFGSHAIYTNNNMYFDPSYSSIDKSGSKKSWEDKTIHGVSTVTFAELMDTSGQVFDPPKIYIYHHDLNTPNEDFQYTVIP